jgi:hypothetical protein
MFDLTTPFPHVFLHSILPHCSFAVSPFLTADELVNLKRVGLVHTVYRHCVVSLGRNRESDSAIYLTRWSKVALQISATVLGCVVQCGCGVYVLWEYDSLL